MNARGGGYENCVSAGSVHGSRDSIDGWICIHNKQHMFGLIQVALVAAHGRGVFFFNYLWDLYSRTSKHDEARTVLSSHPVKTDRNFPVL